MESNLIFDFDGTIANSFEAAESIFYELTGHEKVTDQNLIAHLRSLPLLKAAKEMHVSPTQLPRLLIKGRAMMQKRIGSVKAFSDIVPILKHLHDEGHKLFIISSNSQRNIDQFVRNNNLSEYFDGIYAGIGLFSKARAIRRVIRRNKIDSKNCYYIGDEVRDIVAAKHAKVRAVGVAWGYNDAEALKQREPFAVIKHPKELLRLFNK